MHDNRYCGHPKVVRMLIRASQSTVGIPDKDYRTPLHWSTKHANRACLNALCDASPPAAVNQQDSMGVTPLHWAVLYNRPKNVARLLRGGANASLTDKEGHTPLHYAVGDARTACLEALLKSSDIDVNVRDGSGRAPLHLAAHNGDIQCLSVLVADPDISINAVDAKGTTPLHWAAVSNNIAACCLLVQYGADLDAQDGDGMTAEKHADAQGFHECVVTLQDLRKNPMAHIEYTASATQPSHPSPSPWRSAVARVKAQNAVRRQSSSACVIC